MNTAESSSQLSPAPGKAWEHRGCWQDALKVTTSKPQQTQE